MKWARFLTLAVLTWVPTLITSCAETATPYSLTLKTENFWNFDIDKTGQIATSFTNEVGEWKVVEDATAPSKPHVLAQLAKSPRATYNVALAADTNYGDVDISLELKAVAGEVDQGGGPVWRAKDAKNYYIARYNPLEDNYRVYKVVEGKRSQLGTADIDDYSPDWHTLRVTMKGDHIECYYDDKKYLDVKDQTFGNPGRVGLWTKADAQTHFDDFRVTETSLIQP